MQLYYNAVPSFMVKYMAVTLKETTWENHIPINKKNEMPNNNQIVKMQLSAAAQVSHLLLHNRLFGLQYYWQPELEWRLFKLHNCNVISGFWSVWPELPK